MLADLASATGLAVVRGHYRREWHKRFDFAARLTPPAPPAEPRGLRNEILVDDLRRMRLHAQYGTGRWEAIEASFRRHLEADFISSDGRLMGFRSTLTGLGTPAVGGAILQSLPCLFLNTILSDIAHGHRLPCR
jgi:hypothetical protein